MPRDVTEVVKKIENYLFDDTEEKLDSLEIIDSDRFFLSKIATAVHGPYGDIEPVLCGEWDLGNNQERYKLIVWFNRD